MQVTYVDHMGSDKRVVDTARISFDQDTLNASSLTDKDKKLVEYLAKHRHTSPFEHCILTVEVECPLFIAAQWMRHRTMSYNQISRRYTSEDLTYWTPAQFRQQSTSNRQASSGALAEELQLSAKTLLNELYETAQSTYDALVSMGVSREQARAALPQGLNTRFIATANLSNWTKFIKLRDHEGAQGEIQELAKECQQILLEKFPIAGAALLCD